MSSFRLLSQQVLLVGFGVFELFFFLRVQNIFYENCVRVTIYEKNETKLKERKVSAIQRSTRSATRSPTRSLTRTRTRCPTRGFRIPVKGKAARLLICLNRKTVTSSGIFVVFLLLFCGCESICIAFILDFVC